MVGPAKDAQTPGSTPWQVRNRGAGRASYSGPLLLALCAVILSGQVLVRPAVGLSNNGDFPKMAGPLGLGPEDGNWQSHEQYHGFFYRYVRADRYNYDRKFLTTEFLSSEYFFVKLARGLQKVFRPGPRFDIRWLGFVNGAGLFLAIAIWIYAFPPRWRLFAGAFVVLIWTDIAYVQYLNTFYMDTAALVSLVLFVAAGLHAVKDRQSRIFPLLMAVAAILFATSKTQHAVPAFLLVPLLAGLAFWSRDRVARGALLSGAVLVMIGASVVLGRLTPSTRNGNVYNVVFMRITPAVREPLRALEELGLAPQELRLVGTYNYSPDSPMQNPEWAREFGLRCNFGRLLRYFLRHPSVTAHLLYQGLSVGASRMQPWLNSSPEDGLSVRVGGGAPRKPGQLIVFDSWSSLRSFLLLRAPWHVVLLAFATAAGSLWLLFGSPDSSDRAFAGLALVIQLVAASEFASAILADGLETARHVVIFHVATDISILLLPLLALRIYTRRGGYRLARLDAEKRIMFPRLWIFVCATVVLLAVAAVAYNGRAGLRMPYTQPLGGGRIDDTDPRLVFVGDWPEERNLPSAYQGTVAVAFSDGPGAQVKFNLEGRGFRYTFTRAFNRGMAEIVVDDERIAVVDLYGPDIVWQDQTTIAGLSPGPHRVAIRELHQKNPASSGYYIDIDSIEPLP
jgi:hypothetical protein